MIEPEDRLAGYLDRICQLAPPVVEALHDAGLFRIFLPAGMGGGELTVPESLKVFEAMARLDASAGWNLAICADGPLFGHFVSREAYGDLQRATGRDRRLAQSHRHARGPMRRRLALQRQGELRMTAAVELHDGSPRMIDGVPAMRSGLFPMKHCRILDTWSVTGMRGTGSNDCVFEDVFVPDAFTYEWPNPRSSWQRGAFAGVSLATQLGGGLAAVALGAARHAIDAFMELAGVKVPAGARAPMRERPMTQMQLGQAEGWLQAGRAYLFNATEDAWRLGETGVPFDASARATARLASVTAAKLAAQATDLVHEAAGMNAVQTSCEIERCWRDVHTITQHVILGAGRYEVVRRIMLGLDAGSPII